jgi:hypothetical protein
MRIAILGLGSMGQRHLANLRLIAPVVEVVVFDTDADRLSHAPGAPDIATSADAAILAADGVMVCTPQAQHLGALLYCAESNKPLFIEKPLVALPHTRNAARYIDRPFSARSSVGFCYASHPVMHDIRVSATRDRVLEIEAWDELIHRYGPTVLETMTSHAVDMALRTFGPVRRIISQCDGVAVEATLYHTNDARTEIFQRMDVGPRHSRVGDRMLYPDDDMYCKELADWLDLIETGSRNPALATLEDGMAVNRVLIEIERAGVQRGSYA